MAGPLLARRAAPAQAVAQLHGSPHHCCMPAACPPHALAHVPGSGPPPGALQRRHLCAPDLAVTQTQTTHPALPQGLVDANAKVTPPPRPTPTPTKPTVEAASMQPGVDAVAGTMDAALEAGAGAGGDALDAAAGFLSESPGARGLGGWEWRKRRHGLLACCACAGCAAMHGSRFARAACRGSSTCLPAGPLACLSNA